MKKGGLMDGASSEPDWITMNNGEHVPITDGKSADEAIKEHFHDDGKKKYLSLPKPEYAGLCSAIRTRYADKIPNNDGMLYNDHYYRYNYDYEEERIVCVEKIIIDGNEKVVKRIEEKYKNE
jgi:hypothetical protein